ncbi:competence type IV pilus major pilin ComGC [Streptococcus suis]|uniref:competence type IV pilus major pilin ComGC n=1 Tax=Streptococcus parasuis TaxID=1501662 RepID=UPI0015C578A0
MKKMLKKKVKGFTLIEMLVVLGIISILLLLFVPNLSNQKEVIQKKGDAAIVKIVESQMDIYELDHGVRPTAEELYNQQMITKDQREKYNNAPKE